jgi:hypothetical protein
MLIVNASISLLRYTSSTVKEAIDMNSASAVERAEAVILRAAQLRGAEPSKTDPSTSAFRLTRAVPVRIGFTDEWTNCATDYQWKFLGLVKIANKRQQRHAVVDIVIRRPSAMRLVAVRTVRTSAEGNISNATQNLAIRKLKQICSCARQSSLAHQLVLMS